MIEPSDEIPITLSFQEWNTVFGVLGDAPFRMVAPIIGKMQAQTQAAAQLPRPPSGRDREGVGLHTHAPGN